MPGSIEISGEARTVVTVPMHYRTGALAFELDPVDDFLKGREAVTPQEELQLTKEDLSGEGKVVLLTCPGAEREPANR